MIESMWVSDHFYVHYINKEGVIPNLQGQSLYFFSYMDSAPVNRWLMLSFIQKTKPPVSEAYSQIEIRFK